MSGRRQGRLWGAKRLLGDRRLLLAVGVAIAGAVLVLGLGAGQAQAGCLAEGPADTTVPWLGPPTGDGPAGETLTVNEGTWAPVSGSCDTQVSKVTYDWYRNTTTSEGVGGTFSGTTGGVGHYTTVNADLNEAVTAQVTACGNMNDCNTVTATGSYTPVPVPVIQTYPTVSPSGAQSADSTFTATSGTWSGSPTSYSYQWLLGTTAVGTNSASYSPACTTAYGETLTVKVTASNAGGASLPAASSNSAVLDRPCNTVAPTVSPSGAQSADSTFTATSGTWSGSPTSYSYQWLLNGSPPASGGTSASYSPACSAYGETLTVKVTATNANGASPAKVSSNSAVLDRPCNTVAPTVSPSGAQSADSTFTATSGTWSGSPTSYSYQWLLNGSPPASGGTSASYSPACSAYGETLTVKVTATNANGASPAKVSSNSAVLDRPCNTVAPTVSPSGAQSADSTFTATSGTWSGSPTSYSYQWLLNGSSVSGATSASYSPACSAYGETLTVQVTATNANGASPPKVSSNSAVLDRPCNTTAPTITPSGTGRTVGEALSTSNGSWSGSPSSYGYRWLRDSSPISGATGSTYTTTSADVGHCISSQVDATNGNGTSDWVTSSNSACYVNHSPPAPTNLLPVDGRIANNDTPTLSSTFSDPDGQSGTVSYSITKLDGTAVTSGQSAAVASGSTASWTVPSGELSPGTSYYWYAQAADSMSATSSQVGPFKFTDQYRLGATRFYTLSSQSIDDQESLGVNVGNGNLVLSANDLQLPGVAGFDLTFTRTYNSLYAAAQDLASSQPATGWQTLASLGIFSNGEVRYAAADGSEYTFDKNPDGTYATPPGVDAALAASSGTLTSCSSAAYSYLLSMDADGSKRYFNSTGQSVADVDRNGNTICFNWSGAQLASITDTFGRTTSFKYNSSGQLMTIADPQNRAYQYGYDSSGRLTSYTDPTGKSTGYAYNSAGLLSQITVTTAGSTQAATAISYDASNRVSSIQTGLNSVGTCASGTTCPLTTFAYNATDPSDSFCSGNPTTNVLAPDQQSGGNPTRYCFDSSLRVTGIEAPDKSETLTDYTTAHGGSGCADSNGNSLDDLPCATSDSFDPTSSSGNWTTYTYSATHPEDVLSIVQPAPSDAATTYVYGDSTHPFYPTQVTSPATASDPNGVVTNYTYDATGNTTETDIDQVRQSAYTYNIHGQVSGSEDGNGNWTGFTYDVSGNVASRTTGLNSSLTCPVGDVCPQTTYTYDGAGRVLSETDPLGGTTRYTYDNDGRLTSVTQPDPDASGPLTAPVTSYAYDGAGNQTRVTNANGYSTHTVYDANNEVTSTQTGLVYDSGTDTYSCPSNETCPTAQYTYDANGNKLAETDPNGDTTNYAYNALNEFTAVTTPGTNGGTTTYGYNANGEQTTIVDPRGNVSGALPEDYTTTRAYNADGQLISVTDPLGNVTSYGYDAAGNQTSVTDANGNVTLSTYDGSNRVTSVQTGMKWNSSTQSFYCPTSSNCPKTVYTYDAMGNEATVTDPDGNQTKYAYNNNELVSSMQSGLQYDSGTGTYHCLSGTTCPTTSYSYDANGNEASIVEPSAATVSYSYDQDNRATQTAYSDSTPTVSYTYDAVGNRLSMTDGAGTVNYTYNNNNQLLSDTRGNDTFSYAYDAAGNVTSRTYPDGTSASYAYNQDEQLNRVTSAGNTTSYTYDPAGNLLTTTLPNGYVETRTYDRAARLTEVDNAKSGTVLSDYAYTLDPVGNPTKVVQTGAVSGTTTYAYDGNDRLVDACYQTSCNEGAGSNDPYIHYTYDEAGNRLTDARPSVTTNYVYNNNNQLCATSTTGTPSCGTPTYSYDANGNETSKGSSTFTYNAANQLISATSNGTTTNYTYDGDGNRLQASVGGNSPQITNYVWDTNNSLPQLAIERDGNGAELRNYLYGVQRISMMTGGSAYYYAYDGLGSVVNVTSPTGATEWTYSYEPFGAFRTQTQNDTNAPYNPMQFNGELLDSATGLYDLRARQYDATSGRFLSQDAPPTEGSGIASDYQYASDDPTMLVDPSGQEPRTAADLIWCLAYPVKCVVVVRRAKIALNEERSLEKQGVLEGWDGGTGAAFRHCFWSALVTLQYGTSLARTVGFNHEWQAPAPGESPKVFAAEAEMGLHNNQIGRRIASDIGAGSGGKYTDANINYVCSACLFATHAGPYSRRLWVRGFVGTNGGSVNDVYWANGMRNRSERVPVGEAESYYAQLLAYIYENASDYGL